MTRRARLFRYAAIALAAVGLTACASGDNQTSTLELKPGCFEVPVGKAPNGETPIACTTTGTDTADLGGK